MDHSERFRRALIRMIQEGTFQQIVECPEGQCAKVEFHLRTIYHVHLARRYAVVQEHDVEAIRRQVDGRWTWLRPTVTRRSRIVIERASGKIVESPTLGAAKGAPVRFIRGTKPRRTPQPQQIGA